ncbi:MAG TPA: ABC transporter ATP-binding protein [Ancylobacter sp.]
MKPLFPLPSTAAPALRVEALCKSFRKTQALAGVDFCVPEGSLTVLLGAAGAGKTTTLRVIAGLDRPDSGRVFLRGEDAGAREPKDRDIAMIFDNLALYPNKTGFENIAHPLRIHGMARADIEAHVAQVSATLRIGHILQRLPKTMSGGERQRVALGRALVRQPTLFLLDEPLSSLDAMLRIELRAELKRLQREFGYSFLFATPDFAEAMAVADTVVMLREGKVVQVADAQTLYERPADREIARFVGAPEINLLPAQFDAAEGGRVRVCGASLEAPAALRAALGTSDIAFDAGIRPEHLRLVDPARASIRAGVTDIEPLGLKSAITAHSDGAELRLVVDAVQARGMALGEAVGLSVDIHQLHAFDRASGLRLG